MTAEDFRRIALGFDGGEEGSHMGATDFRVGGGIFATLASISEGYGNLMLTPEQQADFVAEQPDVYVPIKGGWGRMGMTHIRLEAARGRDTHRRASDRVAAPPGGRTRGRGRRGAHHEPKAVDSPARSSRGGSPAAPGWAPWSWRTGR